MPEPMYDLDAFLYACENNVDDIIVTKKAKETALTELKLKSKKEILEYLTNLERDKFKYKKTDPSDQIPGVMIDVYKIKVRIHIYFAFHSGQHNKWIIKSFKIYQYNNPDYWFGDKLKKELK